VFQKPEDLLAHAQESAPGAAGSERETRTSWVVTDEEAPMGKWWVAKCCGRVFEHSAHLGGHRCSTVEPPWQYHERRAEEKHEREARAAARSARLAARPWYRFW